MKLSALVLRLSTGYHGNKSGNYLVGLQTKLPQCVCNPRAAVPAWKQQKSRVANLESAQLPQLYLSVERYICFRCYLISIFCSLLTTRPFPLVNTIRDKSKKGKELTSYQNELRCIHTSKPVLRHILLFKRVALDS